MISNSIKRALFAHTLSKYDVFLFGFLAPIVKPLFFPKTDPVVASLAVFGSFAAGYFMRPLGALFFSHIGDRQGRRIAFMMTVCFMILPTFIIGVTPGYTDIGIFAPLIIILCRLVQGFGAGGEFSGIAVYSCEMALKNKIGYVGGLVRSVGFLGTAVGTAIVSIMILPIMPQWGWRLAFILGAVATLFSFSLRRKMEETEDFKNIKHQNKIKKLPILDLLKNYPLRIFSLFLINSCAYIFMYISTVYMNSLYGDLLGLETYKTLWASTVSLLLWMILTPVSGYIADKVGIFKFLKVIIVFSLLAVPILFYYGFESFSLNKILILHYGLSVCGALFFGAVPALFICLFPAEIRYTGTAVSNTLAQSLLGGTAPFLAVLFASCFDLLYMAAVPVIMGTILGLLGLYLAQYLMSGKPYLLDHKFQEERAM
jgi:MFS transporter, MHS family, proline/betaine transporter